MLEFRNLKATKLSILVIRYKFLTIFIFTPVLRRYFTPVLQKRVAFFETSPKMLIQNGQYI